MTELQAALGLSQLDRLDRFVMRRREIVAAYHTGFADLDWLVRPGIRHVEDADTTAWHLYTVQIDWQTLGRSRSQGMADLRSAGVGTQVLYIPVHLQPWYRRTYGYAAGKCPIAESLYRRILSLPLYAAMRDEDVQRVIAAVRQLAQTVAVAA